MRTTNLQRVPPCGPMAQWLNPAYDEAKSIWIIPPQQKHLSVKMSLDEIEHMDTRNPGSIKQSTMPTVFERTNCSFWTNRWHGSQNDRLPITHPPSTHQPSSISNRDSPLWPSHRTQSRKGYQRTKRDQVCSVLWTISSPYILQQDGKILNFRVSPPFSPNTTSKSS